MQSFKFLRYALHGDLVEDRRERERRREKIMPILMATSPSAQRRSDQFNKFMPAGEFYLPPKHEKGQRQSAEIFCLLHRQRQHVIGTEGKL